MTFLYFFTLTLFLLLSVVLCLVILMQESKTTGLGASFGGESSDSLFGTSTADVLKRVTAWLAFVFLAGSVILSLWTAAMGRARISTPAEAPWQEEVAE